MIRTLLSQSSAPKGLWTEALLNVSFTYNVIPNSNQNKSPFELLFGNKRDPGDLHVFGSIAYHHIPSELRSKFDLTSKKFVFMGYSDYHKAYRLYDPLESKVIFSRNVRVLDNVFYWKENKNEKSDESDNCNIDCSFDTDSSDVFIDANISSDDGNNQVVGDNVDEQVRRSERENRGVPPDYYQAGLVLKNVVQVPKTYDEALKSEQSSKWNEAMDEEFESILKNDVYEEVLESEVCAKNIVGSRYNFSLKTNKDGEIERYKARLICQGFNQVKDVDYHDVYSPVTNFTTIRLVLTYAAVNNLNVTHLDVKTAFLNGELKENIYVEPPKRHKKAGIIWKLKKSLYGLKQSSRCWSEKLNGILSDCGFNRSLNDRCLYIHPSKCIILVVYIDDILLCTKEDGDIQYVMECLSRDIEVKNLGPVSLFCGLEIKKVKNFYRICQKKYIVDLIKAYDLEDARISQTPLGDFNIDIKSEPFDVESTQKIIGSLQYLSNRTRPDIAASVNVLSSKMHQPTRHVWECAKNILRYLKGTLDVDLSLGHHNSNHLMIYTDADFGQSLCRKSISGILIQYYGSTIGWISKKQRIVSISTAEAEYYAISMGVAEGLWVSRLICDIEKKQPQFHIRSDNQSAIRIFKDGPQRHSKHIDIRREFILENILNNLCNISYIPSDQQISDFLTKPFKQKTKKQLFERVFCFGGDVVNYDS